MPSSKKIGFFCGEEKLTIVDLEKNTPVQVVSALMGSKVDSNSPFSSNLTEEIQITALLQKILQDYRIKNGSFCVSLPMKDIILRSFIIPWVKPGELPNVIKFEAKKYMPFDIQDVFFVFHSIPFTENQMRHIQIIFFAVRKETLYRYERIFQQLKMNAVICDPCPVSLVKALLYKKEIKVTDHLAFLFLDKNLGYICFIDQGIPQFIREFQINTPEPSGQVSEGSESMNMKILNEVGNSFDFYARQFSGNRVEQMIVSSYLNRQDLFEILAKELKVNIKNFSPLVTTVGTDQVNHIEAIYALGAGIDVPMNSLTSFNFFEDKKPKSKLESLFGVRLTEYKGVFFTFLFCISLLVGAHFYFQMDLKNTQKKYDEFSARQGAFLYEPMESLQTEIQESNNKLSEYKDIKIKSNVASILLEVASLLPQGAWLKDLNVRYGGTNSKNTHVEMDMEGYIFKNDLHEEIAAINDLVLGFKNDKKLSSLISSVNLVSLRRDKVGTRDLTSFVIHCS